MREWQWNEGFRQLKNYVAEEGHSRVPDNEENKEGYKIGNWVYRQRYKSKLSQEQFKQLESLPGWMWNPRELDWNKNFELLEKFTEREGHSRPIRSDSANGFNLGIWVAKQRNRKNELAQEQFKQLESLPGWTWDVHEWKWNQGFRQLKNYVAEEGHSRVPDKVKNKEGYSIGYWVYSQRKNKSKLSQEQFKQLESLPGWVWDATE